MWSAQEAKELKELYGSTYAKEGMEAAVLAVATRAGELVAARGVRERGSWSEDLALVVDGVTRGLRLAAAQRLAHDLEVQGATVATLQATVEEMEQRLSGYEATNTALRAEVERLKAEAKELRAENAMRKRRDAGVEAALRAAGISGVALDMGVHQLKERASVAESRLATITEALDAIRDGRRFHGEHTPEAIAKVALALEGDAPQEAEDGSVTCERCDGRGVIREVEQDKDCPACNGTGERYPCSPSCTHDDAAIPGHPERVKERSEAVNEEMARVIADHNRHVDNMGGPVAEAEEGDGGPWVVQSGEEQASEAYDEAAETLREAVEKWAQECFGSVPPTLKDAMDGAAP